MRARLTLGLVLALMAPEHLAAAPTRPPPTACPSDAQPDRLLGLTPEGDLILASGGPARLSGLRLPEPSSLRDKALAWLRAHVDKHVLVQGRASRDRWNRLAARIRLAGEPTALDLGHGLVEEGLAIVDPAQDDALCQPELLALEDAARQRSLGVWSDGGYKPIAVDQADRLRDRIGAFVLVEGRIRTIGERQQRTYLNFGGHWAEDFTIIIPQKTWKLMTDRGLGADALKGRRIRARGILQSWQGTALTIVIPEMIERLEGRSLP